MFCTQWATQTHRDGWMDAPGLQKKKESSSGENGLFPHAHSGIVGQVEETRGKAAYESRDKGKRRIPPFLR